MYISRIEITNFRNFKHIDVKLGPSPIIVGANRSGKTNLIQAIRLILDPTLSDLNRQIKVDDFWNGLGPVIDGGKIVEISISFSDFLESDALASLLGMYLLDDDSQVARIVLQSKAIDPSRPIKKDSDLVCTVRGKCGGDAGMPIDAEVRRRIRLELIQALRDTDSDLLNWRRSPARVLLEAAASSADPDSFDEVSGILHAANERLMAIPQIQDLESVMSSELSKIGGIPNRDELKLGLQSDDPTKLYKNIRIFVDGGNRSIGDESLGISNVIYITLKNMEAIHLIADEQRDYSFLAIEEPEAHLHPTLQRTVFKSLLHQTGDATNKIGFILTTHSPHIVSIANVKSLVRLFPTTSDGSLARSTAQLDLSSDEILDIERYLDVNRGELVFAKKVILVEGDSERFLLPVFAKILGADLDALGIFVCSIAGTNFLPYARFLGHNGLGIPYCVLTDGDPDGPQTGLERLSHIHESLYGTTCTSPRALSAKGLFFNESTLELSIFDSGIRQILCTTITSLTSNRNMIRRAHAEWNISDGESDADQLMKDIEAVGKGRVAQEIAKRCNHCTAEDIPDYIRNALGFIIRAAQ